MELYIEKVFIDDFYLELDKNSPTTSQNIAISIFKDYGDVNKFMDVSYDTPEQLEELKLSNELIAYLFETRGPESVLSIKEHFFKHSKCEQTLIFTAKTEVWFKEAEIKGAICFSLDNYERRIHTIVSDITALNIDSDELISWNVFKSVNQLPFNQLIICDNYILTNKDNQKMHHNVIPLIKAILAGKESQIIPIQILSKDFNTPQKNPTKEEIVEVVQPKHEMLVTAFGNFKIKFKIYTTANRKNYIFHAREILNQFLLIQSGQGFNLLPQRGRSNEVLTATTIFSKSGYRKINKRMILYRDYLNYLNRLETFDFKNYPD